jgi:hypothetical protein
MDLYMFRAGARGGAVVEALRYNPESRGIEKKKIPMVSMEFFMDIILPAPLWLWGGFSL